MREIKFRAWIDDNDNKHFEYIRLGDDTSEYNGLEQFAEQYTGLKDRNGKEIYEGDIVRYKNKDAEYREGSGIGLIQSDDHSHCVSGFSCRDIKTKHYVRLLCGHPLFSIEIIGNIHENPELLKEAGA